MGNYSTLKMHAWSILQKSIFSILCYMVKSSTGWSRTREGKMASGWRKTNDMAIHNAKLSTLSQNTESLEHSLHIITYIILKC